MPKPHSRLIKLERLQNETEVSVCFEAPLPQPGDFSVQPFLTVFLLNPPRVVYGAERLWHLLEQRPVGREPQTFLEGVNADVTELKEASSKVFATAQIRNQFYRITLCKGI